MFSSSVVDRESWVNRSQASDSLKLSNAVLPSSTATTRDQARARPDAVEVGQRVAQTTSVPSAVGRRPTGARRSVE